MSRPVFLDKDQRQENAKKELRRNAILIVLNRLMPNWAILDTILEGVASRGVKINEDILTADIGYWINLGFIQSDEGTEAAVANTHFSITDKGQQYLEKLGLA